ncbi:MAG: peroxiredoxin-like family protein [Chitinophagaceae bacterium]
MRKLLVLILFSFVASYLFAQEAPEGLFLNSKAPNFKAKNQYKNEINLKDIAKKGKVVLVFYRGQWCPYCNKYLARLEDSLKLIMEKGATVIAITPEKPESISKTIEKTKAEYSIIYDEALKIMKAYEVEYEVPANTLKRYQNTGIDLEENNGKNGNYLPIPATYIIDKEMNIIYRYFDADYKKRPSIKEILDNLK